MLKNYKWAVNKVKLQRAINAVGNEEDEAEIKVKYVLLGGLVREDGEEKVRVSQPPITPKVETEPEPEEINVTPIKRTRKGKDAK